MRKLFRDIKGKIHDASGVATPDLYWWEELFGVYYPSELIEEDDLQDYVMYWLEDEGLPEASLDEIPLSLFNEEQLKTRYYLLKIFSQL